MLLKNCKYIITQNNKRQVLQNKDLLIEGSTIKKIGKIQGKGIDCSKKIVMPGLINTHTHLGMHSLKGMKDDVELFDWLKWISKEEAKLTPKKVKENTILGINEAVKFGTTTIYDSYKNAEGRAEAFEKSGVRGVISSTTKDEKTFKKSVAFLKSMKSNLVRGAIAVHSIYDCPEEIIQKTIEYSNKEKILRRVHIGETRKERADILAKKGKLAIEYLDSLGFLAENSLLVHCIWITKGEIKRIAKTGTKVSHNPVSNMKLASGGVMPLVEMLQENITVGLGTDSVASNNNLDLFEEMKTAALLHKHHKWDAGAVTAQQILDMATINGAKCLGIEKIGSLEEGMNADIITLNLSENLMPVNNIISAIVYSANGFNVSDSIINGKQILENGLFINKRS